MHEVQQTPGRLECGSAHSLDDWAEPQDYGEKTRGGRRLITFVV
jgi:hypothetical protein